MATSLFLRGKQLLVLILAQVIFQFSSQAQDFGKRKLPVRPLQTKDIWVLFPHSKDVEKIKVTTDASGRYTFQEDILIDTSQIVYDTSGGGNRNIDLVLRIRRIRNRSGYAPFSAASSIYGWGRWEGAVIPFVIGKGIPANFRERITDAIAHINSKTNLCIRERKAGETNYVEFIPVRNQTYGGRSALGKTGGRQTIEFDIEDTVYGNIGTVHTAIHELLHAAGFIHEHSRSDRDDFVEVIWDNVEPTRWGDLMKHPFSDNKSDYDYKSIMHYKSDNAGKLDKNGDQLTTLKAKGGNIIDPSSRLTDNDIQGVNSVYLTKANCDFSSDEEPAAVVTEALENITYNVSNILANVSGTALSQGTYYIKCFRGGKYLKGRQDGGSCEGRNGSWVVLEGRGSGTCDNKFVISHYGIGYTMKCITKFAEIDGEHVLDNNTRLQLWEANLPYGNHNLNQVWLFYKIPGETNLYIIKNAASGKVLDANNDCVEENDCKVKQWTPHSNDATQVWVLEKL